MAALPRRYRRRWWPPRSPGIGRRHSPQRYGTNLTMRSGEGRRTPLVSPPECRIDRGRAALQGRVKTLRLEQGFSPWGPEPKTGRRINRGRAGLQARVKAPTKITGASAPAGQAQTCARSTVGERLFHARVKNAREGRGFRHRGTAAYARRTGRTFLCDKRDLRSN